MMIVKELPIVRRTIVTWMVDIFLGTVLAIFIGSLVNDVARILRGSSPPEAIFAYLLNSLLQLFSIGIIIVVPTAITVGLIAGGLHGLYLRQRLRKHLPTPLTTVRQTVRVGLVIAWVFVLVLAVLYIVTGWNSSATPIWIYGLGLVAAFTCTLLLIEHHLMIWLTRVLPQEQK